MDATFVVWWLLSLLVFCADRGATIRMHQNCGGPGSGGWDVSLPSGSYSSFGGGSTTCDNDAMLCIVKNCKLPQADLSSFELPAGLQVTLFAQPNFGGASKTYKGPLNMKCLVKDGWNDKAKSMRVWRGGGSWASWYSSSWSSSSSSNGGGGGGGSGQWSSGGGGSRKFKTVAEMRKAGVTPPVCRS